jgi:small subunit ribosomal protein S8
MYSLSNALTALRNGQLSGKSFVRVKYSKIVWAVLIVLYDSGFISGIGMHKSGSIVSTKGRYIFVLLKRLNTGRFAINKMHLVSTPGKRVYVRVSQIVEDHSGLTFKGITKSGFTVRVLSTVEGVISEDNARMKHLGGEVLCEFE